MLGVVSANSETIAKSMLKPETGRELHELFLARGALATTAIEGNTLNEEDALKAVQGTLELPASQQYLGQEIRNILDAANGIKDELIFEDGSPYLSVDKIKNYNGMVLHDLPVEENVVPGSIRDHSVGVARYRGAPWQDCEFLLSRLCDWLNDSPLNTELEADRTAFAVLKAVIAHLYLAWIHPFGDGNGRTARLMEVQILLAAHLPVPVCHLLSNHYNATRSEYYRQLDLAGKTGDPIPFVEYAVQGLVDGISDALEKIRGQQFRDRWEQYIYETIGEIKTEADRRRLKLALAISENYNESLEPVSRSELRRLTADLSELYADRTEKTLTRDINAIGELGLIEKEGSGYVPRDWIVFIFQPDRRDASDHS